MEIVQENNRFSHLLNALETGWEVEEPVLIGKLWRTEIEGGAYHFVLKNKLQEKTTLVSVTPSPQLLAFLAENKISISAL